MKATVGVYDSHEKAKQAIIELKKANFPVEKLSLIGQAEVIDDDIKVKSRESYSAMGLGIGAILGPVLGILTGVGVFAIPGLGFLYGAGAIVGAIAGLDFGIIGGGIATVLTEVGIKDDYIVKYEEHLKEGNFIVLAQGSESDVDRAKEILHTTGQHMELNVH